jgi:tripartite-type tricarboxylate transporter receptor subunit TctC
VRSILILLFVLGVLVTDNERSSAEDWPARPVKIVVAFPPGGTIDVVARELAEKLSQSFGQSFYVENRSGASGNTGTDYVAKAAPDGYTLLMGSDINFAVAPNWDSNLPYKVSEFAPVSLIADMGLILAARPSLGISNVHELIKLARNQPGKITYGSSGPGSTHELAMELLQQLGGFKLTEIPYRGSAQALPDLLSGQIQVLFLGVAGLPYFRSGQLRALGVGTLARFESLPDVPTIAEQGFPDFEANIPGGIYVPAGTPQEIINKLQQRIALVLSTKDIRERFGAIGAVPIGSTPDALVAHINKESEKWARLIHYIHKRADR